MNINNKWMRAAIPALLIHISVGTVYCWSTFKQAIAEQIGMNSFSVGWAFSFAIFFLGMSAAFAGKFVEKNIHQRNWISYSALHRMACPIGNLSMLRLYNGNRTWSWLLNSS